MDFFNKFADTVVKTGKTVGEKAKEITDVTKLRYEIHTKETELAEAYQKIGKKYYDEHKADDVLTEPELFEKIGEAKDRIKELKEQVADAQGDGYCPQCGTRMPQNAQFCPKCGAKKDDIYEEEKED